MKLVPVEREVRETMTKKISQVSYVCDDGKVFEESRDHSADEVHECARIHELLWDKAREQIGLRFCSGAVANLISVHTEGVFWVKPDDQAGIDLLNEYFVARFHNVHPFTTDPKSYVTRQIPELGLWYVVYFHTWDGNCNSWSGLHDVGSCSLRRIKARVAKITADLPDEKG